MVAAAPDGVPMATLPVFTPFITSSSLVSSVPPWNSTWSSPLERSVIALANQSSATAPDSGTGVIWAMISLVGCVCAMAGALPSARMPVRPPAPWRMLRRRTTSFAVIWRTPLIVSLRPIITEPHGGSNRRASVVSLLQRGDLPRRHRLDCGQALEQRVGRDVGGAGVQAVGEFFENLRFRQRARGMAGGARHR